MSRKLLSALAAGLLLTAAPLATAPAQAMAPGPYQAGDGWVEVQAVTEQPDIGTGKRYFLHLLLKNRGTFNRRPSNLLIVSVRNGSASAYVRLSPVKDPSPAAIADPILKPGDTLPIVYELPNDPAMTELAAHIIDGPSYSLQLFKTSLAELRNDAYPLISGKDLKNYDGRWRTSLGTLLTLDQLDGYLGGTAMTVGQKVDFAQYFKVTGKSSETLEAEIDAYVDGRRQRVGTMELQASRIRPLKGRFVSGAWKDRTFAACPVADDDLGPWQDPMLRVGDKLWARMESVESSKLPSGFTQLKATFKVWNVSAETAQFQTLLGKGYDIKSHMQRLEDDGRWTYILDVGPCQAQVMTVVAGGDFSGMDSILMRGGPNGQAYAAPWNVAAELAKNPSTYEDSPPPAPQPAPPPAPDSGASKPTREGSGDGVPAALRSYSNYGIWDFRLEELKPGPDGEWQAVVRVRDAASYRVGLEGGGVGIWLFDEDGRSVASNDIIYRASVTGRADQLEAIPQTMWMEKGDEIRVRLLIRGSKGFKPVRLRLGSGDRETLSRTWPMP